MQYSQSQWLLFFFLYCFLGWVWECLYMSALEKQWINRGFLHGPFIPIYGFGAIIVLWLTAPVRDNIFLIFITGMLGATALEYLTGVTLQQVFHARYWDYSNMRFNLNGYICPFCSFGWGAFSVATVKFLHVFLENVILKIPANIAGILSIILVAVYAADTAISVQTAFHLPDVLDHKQSIVSVHECAENISVNNKTIKEKI